MNYYDKVMKYRNENNAMAKLLEMETVDMREGYAKAVMNVGQNLLNPQGALHGGVLYTLADIAGGSAAASRGYKIATLDADFHYLRAGLNVKSLVAETDELKYGKRVSVYNISVKDQDGKVLATGTFSYVSLGVKMELDD